MVGHRPLVGLGEQRREHLLAVLLAAGSIGSRLHSSGSLRKRRMDLDHRSIEHIVPRSPLGCWLLAGQELLEWPRLEIELLHSHRNRRSFPDDHRRLAGTLGHSHAVEVDFP